MKLQRPFDPVVTFRNSQGEAARGTLLSLQRHTLVMEIYNPYSIVQVSEVLQGLSIRSGERVIYKGSAVVVSLLNTGLMLVVSVSLIEDWNDLQPSQGDVASLGLASRQFVEGWVERFRINRGYLVAVSEIRAYLTEVSRWTDHVDLSHALPRAHDGRLEASAFLELATPMIALAARYFASLEEEIQRIEDDDVLAYHHFAQATLHPMLLRAPFVYRTFAKPLGYAGDYEMVNQILSDPQQGPTTYFQMINTLFLQSAVAEAHRNRINILVKALEDMATVSRQELRPVKILNIGCGPAVEVERFLGADTDTDGVHFTLVDFSDETLKYAQNRLEGVAANKGKPIQVNYVNDSVHALLKRASREPISQHHEQFDFVYCAGLFDYLSDKVCSRLLDYLASKTRPGGKVLVTNVHASNSQRGVMEHVLEWHLIYRTEAELQALLPNRRSHEALFTDATGVNVFAEFRTLVNSEATDNATFLS